MAMDELIETEDQYKKLNTPKVTSLYWNPMIFSGKGTERYQSDDKDDIY